MTAVNPSVSGTVFPQDGDSVSETNLARVNAKSNATDYVERGLGFSPDFTDDTLDIGNTTTAGNFAIIEGSNKAYELFPEQATDLSLPNGSGVNYVYLVHDPATDDDISYHIDDDDTPPSNPSLKIGTVDTSADTFDDTINRVPDVDIGQITVGTLANDGSPITLADVLDLDSNDLVDDGVTIWDTSNQHIPVDRLQHDSLTVTAGDGLKGGGSVSLNGSTTLNTEPADFAGTFLSDDGSDNLTVNIGDGLKGSSGSIVVEPADYAGTFLSDDGADNLTVDIGSNLENDGSDNIKVSDSAVYTDEKAQDGVLNISDSTISYDDAGDSWGVDSSIQPLALFGDGSDGSITRSSNGNENGRIYATDYTIQSGVTRTVSNGIVVIHATNTITIDGTLDASGQGGAGGSGGTGGASSSDPGDAGTSGNAADYNGASGSGGSGGGGSDSTFLPGDGGDGGAGAGGGGGGGGDDDGDANGSDGGSGGDAVSRSKTNTQISILRQYLTKEWDDVYDLAVLGGTGGGGGGGGGGATSAQDSKGGDGGAGGAGGGVIILISPDITINGTVDVSGIDGTNGNDGNSGDAGGGGGGAGGNGGFFGTFANTLSNNGTIDTSGGTGGSGGVSPFDGASGGTGGDGTTALDIRLTN